MFSIYYSKTLITLNKSPGKASRNSKKGPVSIKEPPNYQRNAFNGYSKGFNSNKMSVQKGSQQKQ